MFGDGKYGYPRNLKFTVDLLQKRDEEIRLQEWSELYAFVAGGS